MDRRTIRFYTLLTANGISMIGNLLTMVAVPWFVLQTTGSPAKTGLIGFFTTVPVIIAAFFGGTLVDRVGYKNASIIADITSALTVALIPLLFSTTGMHFWQLLALVFLGALLDTPGTTARQALVPDVAAEAGMSLERANALYQLVQRGALLLGPSIAGVLIAWLGPSNVLWIDAATFVCSAALVAATIASTPRPSAARPSYWRELCDGLIFLRRDGLLLGLVLVITIMNFLDTPLFAVILPVLVIDAAGRATDLGLLLSGFGAGSIAGTLLFSAYGQRLPRRAVFVAGFALLTIPLWVLASLPSLPVAITALIFSGIASGPINPLFMTIGQERVPATMRGRVFGIVTALALVAAPLGMITAGYLVEWLGVRAILIGIALAYTIITVVLLITSWRRWRARSGIARLSGAEPPQMPRPKRPLQ